MSAVPESHDPLTVQTLDDGAVWRRAAVTVAGRGLYVLDGVAGCPREVMATLPELAVFGVRVPDELAVAVAAMGALPMPVGDPLAYGPAGVRCGCGKDAHSNLTPCDPDPVALTEQQIGALVDAGNAALGSYYHERACACSEYPAGCATDPLYAAAAGYWDTDAFAIGMSAVIALWESMRATVAELEAQAGGYTARDLVTALAAAGRERDQADARRDLRPGAEAARRMIRRPGTCDACGDGEDQWCPDCAACRLGCYGGHEANPCTHPNTSWSVTPGALAEQRHLMDPLDHTLTHLADGGVS